jgi:hypothetical protein
MHGVEGVQRFDVAEEIAQVVQLLFIWIDHLSAENFLRLYSQINLLKVVHVQQFVFIQQHGSHKHQLG